MKIMPEDWVYEHLVCEFSHWDVCLTGLIEEDGVYKFVTAIEGYTDTTKPGNYEVDDIAWNAECDEYLDDYRVVYKHWFHKNGQRVYDCPRGDMSWFNDKWDHKNPIASNAARGGDA